MSNNNPREWLLSKNKFFSKNPCPKKTSKSHTISITSGKGGVGKSSLALKMSKIFCEWGFKVLVIDCDYNLSNTSIKLGVPLNNDFYSLVKNEKTFEECLYIDGNFHLLPGCNGNLDFFSNDIELDRIIINLLLEKQNDFDLVFLDCPAGLSKEALSLNAYTDFRFFIINPDQSSLTDSYSLMKILKNNYGIKENHVLLNKVSNLDQYKRIIKGLSETVENYLSSRLNVLGWLPCEEKNSGTFNGMVLDDPNSTIHRSLMKILTQFADKNMDITVPRFDEKLGFFKSIFKE
jgi:flagellar biosynthesis protein FlhG